MMSNYVSDKNIAPSLFESLPFNELCIYFNNYVAELKERKKRADEEKAENERMKRKMKTK